MERWQETDEGITAKEARRIAKLYRKEGREVKIKKYYSIASRPKKRKRKYRGE